MGTMYQGEPSEELKKHIPSIANAKKVIYTDAADVFEMMNTLMKEYGELCSILNLMIMDTVQPQHLTIRTADAVDRGRAVFAQIEAYYRRLIQ